MICPEGDSSAYSRFVAATSVASLCNRLESFGLSARSASVDASCGTSTVVLGRSWLDRLEIDWGGHCPWRLRDVVLCCFPCFRTGPMFQCSCVQMRYRCCTTMGIGKAACNISSSRSTTSTLHLLRALIQSGKWVGNLEWAKKAPLDRCR